jgi:hypothetical protein
MLGTFLAKDPTAVPASVVRFVAEQLGLDDEDFAEYGARSQTAYEHAWEIRDVYEYRDFAAGEEEVRAFLAAALATIAEVVPDTDGDDDAEWRAELVARYGTVRGFIRLLVDVIDFGAVKAGAPIVSSSAIASAGRARSARDLCPARRGSRRRPRASAAPCRTHRPGGMPKHDDAQQPDRRIPEGPARRGQTGGRGPPREWAAPRDRTAS